MFVTASNLDIPPFNLPNLDKVPNIFVDYVDAIEEEALVKLLGRQLYKSFIDGLAALPATYSSSAPTVINTQYVYGNDIWKALTVTTGVTPVAGANWELVEEGNKWLELKNGAEYEYASKTWTYKGVVDLLTPLVSSCWIRDNVDAFTGSAVVVPSNENSQIISPTLRITRAYNEYAKRAGVSRGSSYLRDLYVRGLSSHYSACFSYEDTLYGFLTANLADYEVDGLQWVFESPDLMNIANI